MTTQPPSSNALTANPKDIFGAVKVSFSKLPAVAVAHASHAMMDGAQKYGAYNWRDKKVIASIYVDAAQRHILNWFEGQSFADDSGVHHLGHAIACCAILLDAEETGNLIDDRPGTDAVLAQVLDRLSAKIKAKAAAHHDVQKVSMHVSQRGVHEVLEVKQRAGEPLGAAIERTKRENELFAHAKSGGPGFTPVIPQPDMPVVNRDD